MSQEDVFETIGKHPGITAEGLSKILKTSPESIRTVLKILRHHKEVDYKKSKGAYIYFPKDDQ